MVMVTVTEMVMLALVMVVDGDDFFGIDDGDGGYGNDH